MGQSYKQSCEHGTYCIFPVARDMTQLFRRSYARVFAIRSHSYREHDECMGQTQILIPLDGNVFIEHLKKG